MADAPMPAALSRLPYETRVRLEVAETQGERWRRERDGWWWMENRRDLLASVSPAGVFHLERLPDYLNDPAAWGALMEKERIDVRFGEGVCTTVDARACGSTDPWSEGQNIGWAVVMAFLAKHGRTVTP